VGKEDEVVDRLLKFAETTKDAEVAVRAGAIAKGDKAKFAWRLAVRAENASLSVLDEALAFAKEAQDIELMKEVCGKIRTSTSDKDRKINATLTLAAIVSGEDPLGAAGLLEEVLRVAPDNMDALQPLLEIYLKAGKPEEARRVLEGVLKGTLVPDVRAFCLKKLVSLLLDVFKEPENAITYLEEYVALFPDDMAALELLEGLFEQRQLWQKYLMLLARKAQKDKENAVHYYLAMADCAKTRLGDEDMFAGFLARALDIDPGDHVVRLKMMDVLEKRGFFADVVRLLEDEVRQAEGDVVCDLYQKIAEVYNKRLGRRDKAKEALGKALSVAGSANVVEVASWLAGLLEQASSIEERAKDLATKRHSEEWQKFWDDITAVTNYAWFVCLRRCLEIWATEVLLRCPASVALHGHGEKSLPDEARAGIGNALADVYERFADTSKEAAVIEDVRARLVDAVRSVEGKADKADEAGEKAVAAWAENAIGLLEHAVG